MRGILCRLGNWLHAEHKVEHFWRISVIAIVVIGLFLPMGATHAQGLATTAVNYLLTFVAFILQWVIIGIGKLILLLVEVVISVAQYNNFVQAKPVQIGWPIIRDVINMFFIVVLLVSAFSTIIGYSKYHYSEVFKRFFLMAVLVNFSLPLFGVLIDFSQILMLTFVNGFRASAAGNFVTMLQLNNVMKIETVNLSTDVGSEAIENPMVEKVVAMMLGVMILGISATILAIMAIYLIARIVGLWMLLITSPGALFVNGLPGALQGKIPSLGSDWWGRLWGLLQGGPIMAFFLWLALSTASASGSTFIQKGQYAGASETEATQSYFQTAIASVESFGAYLVAIIMLFEGLATAVKSASSTAPIVGNAAKKISSVGMGATKFLAYGGATALGAYGARRAIGGVGAVGSFADRQLNVTKGLGSAIQKVGLKTGWTGAATMGATIAGTRSRAVKREQERFATMTKGLKTSDRMKYTQDRLNSVLANGDEKKMLREQWAKDSFSSEGAKYLAGQYEKDAVKELGEKPAGDEKSDAVKEYNGKVEAYKKRRLLEERRKTLSEYATAAGEDEDKQKWIKEKREASPSFASGTDQNKATDELMDHVKGKMSEDPTYFRKVKMDEFEHAGVGAAMFAAAGFEGNELVDKDGALAKSMQSGDKRAQLMRATREELLREATARGTTIQGLLEDKEALKASGIMDAIFVKDENEPNKHRLVRTTPSSVSSSAPVSEVSRNEEEIERSRVAIERVRREIEGVRGLPREQREETSSRLHSELQDSQRAMLMAGAPAQEVYRMDENGRMNDEADRQSYSATIQNIFNEGKSDPKVYSRVDLTVLNKNRSTLGNEARRVAVQHANVGDLRRSHDAGDDSAKKGIERIVKAIDVEGVKSESLISKFNRSRVDEAQRVDTRQVIEAARKYASATDDRGRSTAMDALESATKQMGLTMEQAVAISKRHDVMGDPVLQKYAKNLSSRGSRAVGRARGSAPITPSRTVAVGTTDGPITPSRTIDSNPDSSGGSSGNG